MAKITFNGSFNSRLLDKREREHFHLSAQDEALELMVEKIIEERCDELENDLEFQGYQILEREYIPVAANIFNFKVKVAKRSSEN